MASAPAKTETKSTELAPTVSEKFVQRVERQFVAEMGGGINWSPLQKSLAQHLYVAIDNALQAAEIRRSGNKNKANDPPITWDNVNMAKLAFDAVHRISLELDAAIKNHIFVIPYLNNRTKKYDLDLRIGYGGVDHTRRKFSTDKILDITYQLVYEGDKFSIDRSAGWEQPVYEPKDYFQPGPVVGGFGYIQYDNPRLNRVIVVQFREFEKAMKASMGVDFWGGVQRVWDDKAKRMVDGEYDEKFKQEMMYKTIVHRVCAKIGLDPAKVNAASLAAIREADESAVLARLDTEELEQANKQSLGVRDENVLDGEIIPEEPNGESEPAAANEASPEEIVAALGLNEDQLTFVKDQLGAGTADFLKGCHADGLKSWKEVNNRIKSDLDTDAKKQEGFSQF
jgi:recombination protein RecT